MATGEVPAEVATAETPEIVKAVQEAVYFFYSFSNKPLIFFSMFLLLRNLFQVV